MEIHGYPQAAIFVVLLLGIGLAFFRPYWAFLFSILLLTAGHVMRFNQTRIAGLGPLLNLTDSCMVVAFIALFLDKFDRVQPIRIPQIVMMMLLVVILGAIQSFWKLGWTYETIRALRWAIQFPVAYFLGANMVDSEKRARQLVGILLVAATIAAVQHILLVASVWRVRSLSMETYHLIRTIGFWAGCMPSSFLIAGALWTPRRTVARTLMYTGAGLLFLATVFLNQTRSLWIATVVAVPIVGSLLRIKGRWLRVVGFAVTLSIMFVIIGCLFSRLLPGLDVVAVVTNRIDRLINDKVHYGTRGRAFVTETCHWADGTLVFGRGLFFFQAIKNSPLGSQHVAFGHLGYVTYLSQLGLFGLLVYGLGVPLHVMRTGVYLWRNSESSSLQFLALLGGASIISLSVMFVGSSHFLGLGYETPGVLYGAMWVLAARSLRRHQQWHHNDMPQMVLRVAVE